MFSHQTIKNVRLAILGLLVTSCSLADQASSELQTDAEGRLKTLNAELAPHFEALTDNVFVASGYGVSTFSFIVGETGVIAIDAGIQPQATTRALEQLRQRTSLPIQAIVLTHGHGDHTGGVAALVESDDKPAIWARGNFGMEGQAFREAGITYDSVRGRRQAGFSLPMSQRINNGIAPAIQPKPGRNVFQPDPSVSRPTHTFSEPRRSIDVAGIRLELVAAPGETADQLYVWYPDKKIVFSGDNFYKSWPNLYAIRGTPYRDVRAWATAVDMMLQEGPEFLVPGHTLAISGRQNVADVLTAYRDGIQFVFDKTIEGINQGLTPDELIEFVQLPTRLANHPYLQPYYGNPQWAIRSIFSGYLGWFDGNPTNLQRHSSQELAIRVIGLAGGADRVLAEGRKALEKGDAQWAAQLADYLINGNERVQLAKLLKADALEELGRNLVTATGRNYYLTVARELRHSAAESVVETTE